jgi:hypothetical protein
VLDQPFDVSDLLLHPSQAVPARRFLLAARRLLLPMRSGSCQNQRETGRSCAPQR